MVMNLMVESKQSILNKHKVVVVFPSFVCRASLAFPKGADHLGNVRGSSQTPKKYPPKVSPSQMLNVWPIYLHLGSFGGKCR